VILHLLCVMCSLALVYNTKSGLNELPVASGLM